MEIVFCDNHILVVNKPAGISTQPHGEKTSLEELAKEWVKKTYAKKGEVFLHAVHRLDTNVSGLVLFARTSKALSRLQELMRKKEIEKIYYAEVDVSLEKEEALLEHYLFHEENKARVVSASHPEGKHSLLSYRLLKKERGISLLEITLHTGRYHQIRAQLAAIGAPIVGDTKYGSRSKRHRISLHHGRLSFLHPVTQQRVEFSSSVSF